MKQLVAMVALVRPRATHRSLGGRSLAETGPLRTYPDLWSQWSVENDRQHTGRLPICGWRKRAFQKLTFQGVDFVLWCLMLKYAATRNEYPKMVQLPTFIHFQRASKDFQGLPRSQGDFQPCPEHSARRSGSDVSGGRPGEMLNAVAGANTSKKRRRADRSNGRKMEKVLQWLQWMLQDFKISRLFGLSLNAGVDEETLRHPAAPSQEGHWWTPGDNRECPKCGTEQPQTSKFCSECGWMLRIS